MASRVRKRRKLRDAAEISSEFEQHYQKLNSVIEKAEAALRALDLRVSASVQLEDDDPNAAAWGLETYLSFSKYKQKWRLVIESGEPGEPETWSTTPLADAPRSERIEAIQKLAELRVAIHDRAEKDLEKLTETIQQVEDTIASWPEGEADE